MNRGGICSVFLLIFFYKITFVIIACLLHFYYRSFYVDFNDNLPINGQHTDI